MNRRVLTSSYHQAKILNIRLQEKMKFFVIGVVFTYNPFEIQNEIPDCFEVLVVNVKRFVDQVSNNLQFLEGIQ